LGRPLWREDGSVICTAICLWSGSRKTHNHSLLSHLRLLGSLSVASYDLQGLRWKYSYQPPHGEGFMKYTVEMGSCTVIHTHTPSFIKTCSGIRKVIRRYTDRNEIFFLKLGNWAKIFKSV
jgi:hypothetical protein